MKTNDRPRTAVLSRTCRFDGAAPTSTGSIPEGCSKCSPFPVASAFDPTYSGQPATNSAPGWGDLMAHRVADKGLELGRFRPAGW
jgi:hypothetical protein